MSNPEGFANCQAVFRLAIMKSLATKRRAAPPPIFVACAAGVSCRPKNSPAPKASGWPRAKPEPQSGRKSPRDQALASFRGDKPTANH